MTLEALKGVGSNGYVVGIDLSNVLIEIARDKLTHEGFGNFELTVMDGQSLDFEDGCFDLVTCASALMAFPDIQSSLEEWKRVLKPAGRVAFSSWGMGFRVPHIANLVECINQISPGPAFVSVIQNLDSARKCEEFLSGAGFADINVVETDRSYSHNSFESYWREATSELVKWRLNKLSVEDQEKVRRLHQAQFLPGEIAVKVPVIISSGVKLG
jgi:SAM-dependent methyltransferase